MKKTDLLIISSTLAFSLLPITTLQAKNTTLESIKAPSAITIDGVQNQCGKKPRVSK